jgi:hypothetical protein
MPVVDVHELPTRAKQSETRGAGGAAPSASEAPSEAISEDALLERAHEAMAAEPHRALALTAQHARRFPRGMLVQEREVIAIEALAHMGRVDRARQRATTFFQTYPNSAYRGRVNAALEMLSPARVPSSTEAR